MPTPKVLVIAGSDSSGGAGLEADQKTLAAHNVFAMTATTALTAQNTKGVQDVHVTPAAFVEKQVRCVMEDGFLDRPDGYCGEGKGGVVKIGMLAATETIESVAKVLGEYGAGRGLKVVLDPVMVSTSGHQLLPGDAVTSLRQKLLPMTYVLTPNIPEALLLLREAHPDKETDYRSPTNLEDLKQLAKQVHALGPTHVLLKGGHLPLTKDYTEATTDGTKALTIDILYPSTPNTTDFEIIQSPYLTSPNTHGTGCSLACALAAQVAISSLNITPTRLSALTRKAVTYISHAISTSSDLALSHTGAHGPINHFHSLTTLAFPPNNFITYLLTHPRISPLWHNYTHHPFVARIADGTLPEADFKHYMIQDYLYLTHFARTYALAAYKSRSMAEIVRASEIVLHINTEMKLHLGYCVEFGISKVEIESTEESQACAAYSRFVLDVGASGDLLGLYVALAPCLLGYGEVARRVYDDPKSKREGNRYWRWVENYVAGDYVEAVRKGREALEGLARDSGVAAAEAGRLRELVEVFREATRMEVGFWEEGAHRPKEVSR